MRRKLVLTNFGSIAVSFNDNLLMKTPFLKYITKLFPKCLNFFACSFVSLCTATRAKSGKKIICDNYVYFFIHAVVYIILAKLN